MMKPQQLYQIQKLYFGSEEIARALGITLSSARVAAGRYVNQGFLIRIKRNLYMLTYRWENATREERFQIASLVQVPSYISLMTALEYYGLTTQLQRNFLESIALKRTKEINVDGFIFKYTKISGHLYSGFEKKGDFFIASPEKAVSLGRYSLDVNAIERQRFDEDRLAVVSEKFPLRTRKLLKKHGYSAPA